MKFLETLEQTLKQDSRFVGEDGRLLKTKIYDACMGMDRLLLEMLISNEALKPHFFVEVDGTLIFDKTKFAWVLESREFLPDSYTMFKNKIGLADSKGNLISQQGDVTLVWPYKDCVLEGGQTKEDQKRDEIFYNETLAPDEVSRLLYPKVFTNAKRYSVDAVEEIAGIKEMDNLIIKGNNLLALASLLKRYESQVKCIYIDPPYNTNSDSFGYNDAFNESTWLTFMRNRLMLAKQMLRNDGAIFISINHIELGYLIVLMDEIFGKENRGPIVTLKAGTTASYRSINDCPVNVAEYVLIYSKTQKYNPNPVYQEAGYTEDYSHYIENIAEAPKNWVLKPITHIVHEQEGCKTWQQFRAKFGDNWKNIRLERMKSFAFKNASSVVSLNTMQKPAKDLAALIAQSSKERGEVFTYMRESLPSIYIYNGRTLAFFSSKFKNINGKEGPAEILTNLWDYISFLGIGPEGSVTLANGKKPEDLIRTILNLSTEEGDLVMDLFLGSGTTAAVAMKMNRRFLGVEQLDAHVNLTTERLQNVINGDSSGISKVVNWKGGGSFIYCELMEQTESIVDKLQLAKTSNVVQNILQQITDDGLIIPSVLPDDLRAHMDEFAQMPLEQQKKLVMELLDKNKLYVNLCDMEDEELAVSGRDKAFTKSFYRMEKEGGM